MMMVIGLIFLLVSFIGIILTGWFLYDVISRREWDSYDDW